MGENFEFFDILMFALVAAYLVYRLRGVLGKRSGTERHDAQPFVSSNDAAKSKTSSAQNDGAQNDNVIALPDRGEDAVEAEPESSLNASFAKIMAVDQSFDPTKFAEGAQMAFEMILKAFTDGDGKTLNTLLSPEVYENFAGAIRARELANNTQETTLVGIKSAEIIDADMDGHDAVVTVKIVSDQINATRDDNGEVIDGDPNAVTTITDIWVFSRDTQTADPNWALIATGSSN